MNAALIIELQFRHTIKKRAEDSAKAYAETAFPGEKVSMPDPLEDDPLLRVITKII